MPGRKLLVADDSLTIQKVIRLALSNEGYEIQAVSDGSDAVQQISLFRPDVVLVDVSLPGKSAFELKREINQLSDLHDTRFVLMSSAFETVDESQAAEVRFHGRLTKPFDPAHLRQVLNDVMTELTQRREGPTQSTITRPPPPLPTSPSREPTREIHREVTKTGSISAPPPLPPTPVIPPRPAAFVGGNVSSAPPLPIREKTGSISAPPPPLPPVPPMEEFERPPEVMDLSAHLVPPPENDDIKHLTESTIKMSGLLDGDTGQAAPPPVPSAAPPVPMADEFGWSVNEPSLKPPSRALDDGGTNFELDLRSGIQTLEIEHTPPIPPPAPSAPPAGASLAAARPAPASRTWPTSECA